MEEDKKIRFKKTIRKIIRFVSYSMILFLMIIASFLIFYVISSKIYTSKGKNPPFGLYTIVSSSMEPNINVYDVVFIKSVNASSLKEDDIITFYSTNPFFGKTPITHRIVNVINDNGMIMFRVKGDANKIEDEELVLEENILGKVCFKLSGFGKIQFFLASKKGIILAVLIPAVFIIIYDIYKIIKVFMLKREMDEIEELEKN